VTDSDADRKTTSMWLHKSLGTKLISAETAKEIARLVTRDRYGQIEVDRNEPLNVAAAGDTWAVTGSQNEEFDVRHPRDPGWAGPVRMRVSQSDGQILEYDFAVDWNKVGRKD